MKKNRYWLHAFLFVLTFISTMIAGTQWANVDPSEVSNWTVGLTYAILILTFLTSHEFGHYIAAKIHGIDTTLPYYIPAPFVLFGTLGAVIRIRERIPSRKVLFDIGVAGPLAGFAVCLLILIIGFSTLPPFEHIYSIHPEYRQLGSIPNTGMYFGDMLLFTFMREQFGVGFIPPMNEIYHYPFLCVGWFGLFVTALNMAPFGNLDGGHVLYSLLGGPVQRVVGRTLWWLLFTLGVLSLFGALNEFLRQPSPVDFVVWLQRALGEPLDMVVRAFPKLFQIGEGWLLWALLVRFFIKIDHPEVDDDVPLSPARSILGWLAILILIVCMPVQVIYFVQ